MCLEEEGLQGWAGVPGFGNLSEKGGISNPTAVPLLSSVLRMFLFELLEFRTSGFPWN